MLTTLLALVTLLDRADPRLAARPDGDVISAVLHPIETAAGEVRIVQQLLKYYVVVWVTFVIMLTGGTITSELGVVADSVLSRGISRWQYFLGKLSSRLLAVLGVYALVMVPTALFIWLGGGCAQLSGEVVAVHVADEFASPATLQRGHAALTFTGLSIGLGRVAVLLALVVTIAVALSASFSSPVISIGVAWVALYGAGLALSLLDVKSLSAASLIAELPEILTGNFVMVQQTWLIAGWLAASALVALASGILFARRDV
jgi:hypothetical protein